MYKSG
jgi:succinyl-CoA synthetase beta subunit